MNKRAINNSSLKIAASGGSGQGRQSQGSSGNSQSLSAAEQVSIASNSSSLRLMMLQEESEFHLFRQQRTTAGKLQRAAKRERMIQLLSGGSSTYQRQQTPAAAAIHHQQQQQNNKSLIRSFSEPDLMRCSVRIIPDAPNLSWEDYRRKRKEYLSCIFFTSAGNLSMFNRHQHNSSNKGFSEYPAILLLTTGDDDDATDDNNEKKKSISPSAVRSAPSVARKLSSMMTVQSVDRFQATNNRLSEKIRHLDDSITRRSSLLSVDHQHRQQQMIRSNSLKTRRHRRDSSQQQQKQRKRRYSSSSPSHGDCCECAHLPLSQTVTLVKVQSAAVELLAETNSGGRARPAHWRACMVSGRDSLSCSLNSP